MASLRERCPKDIEVGVGLPWLLWERSSLLRLDAYTSALSGKYPVDDDDENIVRTLAGYWPKSINILECVLITTNIYAWTAQPVHNRMCCQYTYAAVAGGTILLTN